MNRFLTVVAAGLCLFVSRAKADIAPTRFIGSAIAPVNAPDIRMISARVDIEWSTPCQLSAEFVLDNQSDHPADVPVGFPLNLPISPDDAHPLGFVMSFDGAEEPPGRVTQVGEPDENRPIDATWYRCQHVFPPGRTTVLVKTKLPATLDYQREFVENLSYCIQTGGAWKDTIGSEEVNVHFPEPPTPAQLLTATPAGYTLEGNTVRWRFIDFKPRGEEYDIHLRYLRPDVLPTLARLRGEVARDPGNVPTTLLLVKSLFALAPHKEYAGHLPFSMSVAQYEEVLGKISNQRDRTVFRAGYAKYHDGLYHYDTTVGVTDEWEDLEERLNDVGYLPCEPPSAVTAEARPLLERLLRDHPHDAGGWVVYLANYRHFHYIRQAYYVGGYFFPSQEALLQTAYRNCPGDPFLRLLWQARSHFVRRKNDRETDAETKVRLELEGKLRLALEKLGVFDTDFQKIDYGYW